MKKTVLITGCSSGFGKLAAETFHAKGWNVVATMRRVEDGADLAELDEVLVTRLDVTDPESVEAAVDEATERFGGIDVAVNNAGYGGRGLFEQSSVEAIQGMYDTNVFGLMNVTRAVLPGMRELGEGRVINITSMAGMIGVPGNSIYTSTKFAVEGLTEAMALEYAPLGIRVCSVLPGAYTTTRFGENVTNEIDAGADQLTTHSHRLREHFDGLVEQMAMQGGGPADPQEVADLIFQCATEDMPVHNPVGSDSEMILGMMAAAESRQAFLDQMSQMMMPQPATA